MKYYRHQGAVIIVGLIFMLAMTIIALSALNFATLTEQMANNNREQTQAFQAAESAIKEGEIWLQSQLTPPTEVSSCITPPCQLWEGGVLNQIWSQDHSWWQTQGTTIASSLTGVATQPLYLIETHTFVPYELSPDARSRGRGYYLYRVTAKGTGGTNNAKVVIETIYAAQYN